ncbi:hypothetical protein Tdes44962_MAKER06302 [Teratosphaeria destructans]|uniref:Uncharacterized protein n=1 Tax=Teratosphaeria destructans TaxID=418781 RepID=A0A9W7VY24_9PEZI|nr:hypothetical protein Tdes44962_MAKER06302 [Teratosphaeria destructans]
MSTPSTNPDSTQDNAPTNDAKSSPPASSAARAVPNYTNQNYPRTVPVGDLKAQIAYSAAHQYLHGTEEKGEELEGMRCNLFKQGHQVMIMMRRDAAAETEGHDAVAKARDHLNQLVKDGSFSPDAKYEGFEDPAATKAIDVRDFRKLLTYTHAHLRIKKAEASAPPDYDNAATNILENHGKPEFAKDSQNPQLMTAGMGTFIQATNAAKTVIKN